MNRTKFTLAGVFTALALGTFAGASTAAGALAASPASSPATSPATSPAELLTASVMSGPITVDIQAQRAANSPADSATGVFTAHSMSSAATGFTLHGPVTCLDVRGNKAGLFYPITASDPPVFAKLHSGVFIYLQVNSAGKPKMLGFVPVPFSHTTSCPPGLAVLPVTSGTATLVP
jgi:hypothetical protein